MGILTQLTRSLGGTQQRGRRSATRSGFGRNSSRGGGSNGALAMLGGLALTQLARRSGTPQRGRGRGASAGNGGGLVGGLLGAALGGRRGGLVGPLVGAALGSRLGGRRR